MLNTSRQANAPPIDTLPSTLETDNEQNACSRTDKAANVTKSCKTSGHDKQPAFKVTHLPTYHAIRNLFAINRWKNINQQALIFKIFQTIFLFTHPIQTDV